MQFVEKFIYAHYANLLHFRDFSLGTEWLKLGRQENKSLSLYIFFHINKFFVDIPFILAINNIYMFICMNKETWCLLFTIKHIASPYIVFVILKLFLNELFALNCDKYSYIHAIFTEIDRRPTCMLYKTLKQCVSVRKWDKWNGAKTTPCLRVQ